VSETISLGGTTVRIVTAREEATLLELTLEPGAGAGPHTHTLEDETIAVLDGSLTVDDGRRHELAAGEAIVLPRGVKHSFANQGTERMRGHVFCSPGGLERFFREIAGARSDADIAAAAQRAGLVFG
jgi:quercetin dioxygenase-like cupin family protein